MKFINKNAYIQTAFFAGVYESIFATVAESERDAKARYDAAVRSFPVWKSKFYGAF